MTVVGYLVVLALVIVVIGWMFHVAGFRRSGYLSRFEERRPWSAILMNTASPEKRVEMLPTPFERTRRALDVVLKVVVVAGALLLVAVMAGWAWTLWGS